MAMMVSRSQGDRYPRLEADDGWVRKERERGGKREKKVGRSFTKFKDSQKVQESRPDIGRYIVKQS
jgi:hypothetical protein